jgi:hypothetical protein
MTFIRPLLENSCVVWDSCTVVDADRLEQLQLEAAIIVTGLTSYASLHYLCAKTGWEEPNTKRKNRKLSLFYNIVKGDTSDYLSDLLPRTVNQANNYNLRNTNNFTIPRCRLTLFQNSFFPAIIHLWNNLPQYIRDSPSNCILKYKLKTYYNNPVKPPKYFSFGSRLASILHTRLRQNCSSLKCDLFRCNLIDSCYCNCDNYMENNEHYFLHCKLFINLRNVMLNNIRVLGLDISINNILYGNSDSEYDVSCTLFAAVHRYIMDTKRFVYNVYSFLVRPTATTQYQCLFQY